MPESIIDKSIAIVLQIEGTKIKNMHFKSTIGVGDTIAENEYNDAIPYNITTKGFIFDQLDPENIVIKISESITPNSKIPPELDLDLTLDELFLLKVNPVEFNKFVMEYLYLMYEYQRSNSLLRKEQNGTDDGSGDGSYAESEEVEGGEMHGGDEEEDKFLFETSTGTMEKLFSSIGNKADLIALVKAADKGANRYKTHITAKKEVIKGAIAENKKKIFEKCFFLTTSIMVAQGDSPYYKTKSGAVTSYKRFITNIKNGATNIKDAISNGDFVKIRGLISVSYQSNLRFILNYNTEFAKKMVVAVNDYIKDNGNPFSTLVVIDNLTQLLDHLLLFGPKSLIKKWLPVNFKMEINIFLILLIIIRQSIAENLRSLGNLEISRIEDRDLEELKAFEEFIVSELKKKGNPLLLLTPFQWVQSR